MSKDFISRLEEELKNTLPGEYAQRKMAPLTSRIFSTSEATGKAAVLLLLYPRKGELHILLIKRTEYTGPHSAQVSLPGGKKEDKDRTQVCTALREAAEETGIEKEKVAVLGTLTPLYIPVSNLEVLPVVGYTAEEPGFRIDPTEVEYLIPVRLGDLAGNALISEEIISVSGTTVKAPGYRNDKDFIWGATAMILSEFLEVAVSAGFNDR